MSTISYVIVRYRPLIDTGEFANVGVICLSETGMELRYRLASSRNKRVTQFFDNVDPDSYINAINFLKDELQRLVAFTRVDRLERAKVAFSFFTRVREGVLIFSKPRSVIAEDLDLATDMLFDRLVKRIDAGQPQREVNIAQSIGRELRAANIRSFKAKKVDDEVMPVRLPLVSGRANPFVIKPIAFDQKTTIGMVDHAALWHDRFIYFIEKKILERSRILIPVERPKEFENENFKEAFQIAAGRIDALNVSVIPFDMSHHGQILDFARHGDYYGGGLH